MTNLATFNNQPKFSYDWEQITDSNSREVVKTEIFDYQKTFETNRQFADQLITQDTIAKAKCVARIKAELPHGQFQDVCKEALNLNRDSAGAFTSIAKNIADGATDADVLSMVRSMNERAAAALLKADPEVQQGYVSKYKETGRVPSRSDFEWAKRAQQRKDLEANQNRQYVDAFSDCLENSCHDEDDSRKIVYADVQVISSDVPERPTESLTPTSIEPPSTEVTLSSIQDQIHKYLKEAYPLTDRDYMLLKVIRNTIANYSMGKFKTDD